MSIFFSFHWNLALGLVWTDTIKCIAVGHVSFGVTTPHLARLLSSFADAIEYLERR